jgi:hypothetical protein
MIQGRHPAYFLSPSAGLQIRIDSPIEITNHQSTQRRRRSSVCEAIHEAEQPGHSLSMLFDGQELWQTRSQRKRLPSFRSNLAMSDIFMKQTRRPLKQRLTLANILAAALPEIADGPWLGKNWNKEDISFFEEVKTKEWDLNQPFVTTKFSDPEILENAQSLLRIHPNPSILNFGIMLLEIHLWSPIETFRLPEDLNNGVPNENTDLTTALRLVEERYDDIGWNYRSAIEACLDCNLLEEYDELSLKDGKLRQAFFDHVVAPLEDDLLHLFKIGLDAVA